MRAGVGSRLKWGGKRKAPRRCPLNGEGGEVTQRGHLDRRAAQAEKQQVQRPWGGIVMGTSVDL